MKNWNVFARIALLEQQVNKLTNHINQLSVPPSPRADALIEFRKARQREYSRRWYLKKKAQGAQT